MKVVINASPLILLCNANLEFILPELFLKIAIPSAVWDEITNGSHKDQASAKLPTLDWLTTVSTSHNNDIVRWDLGAGETEVLSYALENPSSTAVLDDMLAKKCAKSFGIPTLGTGSILIYAKQKALIPSVEDALRKLQKEGLWISEPIIQLIKQQAGE